MPAWEYCEVAWTPKRVVIHVYSDYAPYEGVQKPEEWGALLTQLGADGWELVGVVPGRPAIHVLYYFKRAYEASAKAGWEERQVKLRAHSREYEAMLKEQKADVLQPHERESEAS